VTDAATTDEVDDTFTVDEFLGGYEPPRVTVRVTMRADLLAQHTELLHAYEVALRDDAIEVRHPEAPAIAEQIAVLEDEIRASERPFVMQGLNAADYRKLITSKRCRPRKQDLDDKLDFNPETFPVELIAASSHQPKINPVQAQQLFDTLNDSQFGKLWQAAVAVNIGADDAPKSVRRSTAEGGDETSSSTPPSEESPSASSLADA
jgi:hypothetical protein